MNPADRVTLYPSWKQAVADVVEWVSAGETDIFIPDTQLAAMFGAQIGTDDYRFSLLAWQDTLFDKHRLLMLRVREPKGYKLATNKEMAREGFDIRWGRARGGMVKALEIGAAVDYQELSEDERRLLDEKMARVGLTLAVTSPRMARRLLPGRCEDMERPRSTYDALRADAEKEEKEK